MGTGWGLRCKTDGASTACGGEGTGYWDERLRRLVQLAPLVKALYDADTQDDLEIQPTGIWYDHGGGEYLMDFLVSHIGHQIELYNDDNEQTLPI